MFSPTWRRILQHYEGVLLGAFSYGPGLQPGLFSPGTTIGRFCSFAAGLQVLPRNHPTNRVSQHPLFFNSLCGLLENDARPEVGGNQLRVGSDVWIGMNVIICPGCRTIGDGAIIGAGAVVTRDVPPFTVVAGNPARPIRKRFSPEVEKIVTESQWWSRPLPEIIQHLDLFTKDLSTEVAEKVAVAFQSHVVPLSPSAQDPSYPDRNLTLEAPV